MNNKIIKMAIVSAICTQIVACSGFAGGAEFSSNDTTISKGQSKIIVYRNYRVGDTCQNFDVKLDNRSIGTLKCSGFVASNIAPGTHKVDISGVIHPTLIGKDNPTHFTKTIQAAGGKINYFQLTGNGLNGATAAGTVLLAATGVGFSVTQYEVVPVAEKTALSQLHGLKSS